MVSNNGSLNEKKLNASIGNWINLSVSVGNIFLKEFLYIDFYNFISVINLFYKGDWDIKNMFYHIILANILYFFLNYLIRSRRKYIFLHKNKFIFNCLNCKFYYKLNKKN